MILIGIDPSFSGTGIAVAHGNVYLQNRILLQAEYSTKQDNKEPFYRHIIKVDSSELKDTKLIKTQTSDIDDGDMRRILDYYDNLKYIINQIYTYIIEQNSMITHGPLPTEDIHFCIEIPMGIHIGAGAKVDRCYAAALLAVRQFVLEQENDYNKISIVAVNPKKVKKFITGNGNAKKDVVQAHLIEKYGYKTRCIKNYNISDAFAILQYLKTQI